MPDPLEIFNNQGWVQYDDNLNKNNTLYTYAFIFKKEFRGKNVFAKTLKKIYTSWAKKRNFEYISGHINKKIMFHRNNTLIEGCFLDIDNDGNAIVDIDSKKITISSKNTKGDPLVYKMTIISEIKIYSNDKLIKEKNISKKFSYNNISNKFDLKQYEKIIEQNLVEKIKEDIVLILYNR